MRTFLLLLHTRYTTIQLVKHIYILFPLKSGVGYSGNNELLTPAVPSDMYHMLPVQQCNDGGLATLVLSACYVCPLTCMNSRQLASSKELR